MLNQKGAKLCKHGRQFCAECHMADPAPIFDPKLLMRVAELESSLQECASKLESQISRNPTLPKSYQDAVTKAFELLN